jgi:hypothetical protein
MILPELPTLENEALAAAMKPDGELDVELYRVEFEKRLAERHQRLMHDARAVFRAMHGWGTSFGHRRSGIQRSRRRTRTSNPASS